MKEAEVPRANAPRILLIIVARIGDTLLTTPAIRALHEAYPHSEITVLAHPKRLEVLENLAFINTLRPITKHSAPWRGWMNRFKAVKPYDSAIVYGEDSALFHYALRVAHQVVGFASPALPQHSRLQAVTLPDAPAYQIAVKARLALVEALGVDTKHWQLAYQISATEQQWAAAWLRTHLNQTKPCLIGIQTLSFHTKPQRNWPIQHFLELLERLTATLKDVKFVLLGDAHAREHNQPLMERLPNHCLMAAGQTTLRQSAALIGELDLYVGVDTGPTHIAGALGVPMVVLYHADFKGVNLIPQQHPQCRYVQSEASYSLASISVEQVMLDVMKLLPVWQRG